jgi:hypothetical protein
MPRFDDGCIVTVYVPMMIIASFTLIAFMETTAKINRNHEIAMDLIGTLYACHFTEEVAKLENATMWTFEECLYNGWARMEHKFNRKPYWEL